MLNVNVQLRTLSSELNTYLYLHTVARQWPAPRLASRLVNRDTDKLTMRHTEQTDRQTEYTRRWRPYRSPGLRLPTADRAR